MNSAESVAFIQESARKSIFEVVPGLSIITEQQADHRVQGLFKKC
jgi:hypothetical protein